MFLKDEGFLDTVISTHINKVFRVTQSITTVTSNTFHQGSVDEQTPPFLQRFIKGKPKALGIVQIVIGILQIFLGGGLLSLGFMSVAVFTFAMFWSAFLFLISGALSFRAGNNGTRCWVKSSLVMNCISSFSCGIVICMYCFDFNNYAFYCSGTQSPPNIYFGIANVCLEGRDALLHVILALLLILAVLEFCISVSTSVYGCKAVCADSDSEVVQIPFQLQNAYFQGPMTQMPVMVMSQEVQPPHTIIIKLGGAIAATGAMPYEISVAPGTPEKDAPASTKVPPPSDCLDVLGDTNQS